MVVRCVVINGVGLLVLWGRSRTMEFKVFGVETSSLPFVWDQVRNQRVSFQPSVVTTLVE